MRSSLGLGCFGVAVLVAGVGGCGDAPVESESVSQNEEGIVGGSDEVSAGSDATVFLGDCSAVVLNAYTVLTVEHCLPAGASRRSGAESLVTLQVTGGPRSSLCLTPQGSTCGNWRFKVVRQPASEVVALQTDAPLAHVVAEALPVLALTDRSRAYAHGYGWNGSTDEDQPGVRLSAPMLISQSDVDYHYGRASDGARVCGGDSGGPLFAAEVHAPSGSPLLLGVLSASEYDELEPRCTARAGLNRWARVTPEFLTSIMSRCTTREDAIDCRSAEPLSEPTSIPEPAGTRLEELIEAGVTVFAQGSKSAEEVESERLVGLHTDEGEYLARLPNGSTVHEANSTMPGFASGGAPDGIGELAPLRMRGTSLSGNGDQRDEFFVAQAGGINEYSDTDPPPCTGTLIGRRIVRTAKHCTLDEARPYFTLRYNGGPTTWTFDGGSTWVTFNPRRSSFHYYGGNYYNYNCHFGQATGQCIAQDWALLVMPQNVWDPVNVIPSYMGFTTPSTTSVSNAGYAACSSITSPYVSNCQDGIMYGMNCSIVVNYGSYYYTNCDSGLGQSGGPTYRTIGGSRYLVGSQKGGPSNTGCSNGTCQTYDCGTDSWLYNFQLDLRNQYNSVTL